MSPIKLMAVDLDGTLLNDSNDISWNNILSIRKLEKSGCEILICSGRMMQMTEIYLHILEISGWCISCNGALVKDKSGNIIAKYPINNFAVEALIEKLRVNRIECSLMTENTLYTSQENSFESNSRFIKYYELSEAFKTIPMKKQNIKLYDNLDKVFKIVILRDGTKGLDEKIYKILNDIPGISFTASGSTYFDVTAKGVNKGSTMRTLSEQIHVSKKSILSFGNYYNDIQMLNNSGISCAMSNSPSEVKEIATFSIGDNNSNSISETIDKLIMKRENK